MIEQPESKSATDLIPLLFVIGTGRCGTTLFRELLCQHSRLELPAAEMQILPELIEEFGPNPDFSDSETVRRLFSRVHQSAFGFQLKRDGFDLREDEFRAGIRANSWAGVIEALIRASIPQAKRRDPSVLVGDKSPHYIIHLEMLAEILPGSRFVHLVRDPRDVCRSMKRAWGKSLYRGAVRWKQHLDHFEDVVQRAKLGDRCITIRYEDLLSSPEAVLTRVCTFLGLPFEDKMLSPRMGAEKMGDAANATEIVRSNSGKYRQSLSPRAIAEIEAITWDPMHRYGYQPEQATGPVAVNWRKYSFLGAVDLLNSLRSHIAQKGFVAGVKYRVSQFRSKRAAMRSRQWPRGL